MSLVLDSRAVSSINPCNDLVCQACAPFKLHIRVASTAPKGDPEVLITIVCLLLFPQEEEEEDDVINDKTRHVGRVDQF